MVITKDDVPRVRFLLEAPWDDSPPGTKLLTATLFDGRLFFAHPVQLPCAVDCVHWVKETGHIFSSTAAEQAFRRLGERVLGPQVKAA